MKNADFEAPSHSMQLSASFREARIRDEQILVSRLSSSYLGDKEDAIAAIQTSDNKPPEEVQTSVDPDICK
tara:strand:+ start:43 stop:255 length:213 start_codon:yes stop_codon:yes gene_type:complete